MNKTKDQRRVELKHLTPRQLVTLIKRLDFDAEVSEHSAKSALISIVLQLEFSQLPESGHF